MTLGGRLALVTGAARGLGEAIGLGLAQAGARVILADVLGDDARRTAAAMRKDGLEVFGEQLDVTDRDCLPAFVAHVSQTYGDISILVNNAGVASMDRIGDPGSPAAWDRNIAVNLTGAFDTTRAFLPALKATRGTIINVSSIVAFTSAFAHVGYTASKGGIKSLTGALCRELAPFGIRVNAVAPGFMDTPMGGKGDPVTEDWLRWHCPAGRFGEPHEVAAPVVFLASDAASFVNGVTLPIDGGYLVV